MRLVMLVVASAFVLLLAGWTADRSLRIPPNCSSADTQRQVALRAGAYTRECGPGAAVVRFRGKSFTIQGGHCGKGGPGRWLWFGLISGSSSTSAFGANGLSLVLSPGDRPGRVKVFDGIVQVTGRNLGASGTAIVAKGLKSGTFTVVGRPVPQHLTGSWTCG